MARKKKPKKRTKEYSTFTVTQTTGKNGTRARITRKSPGGNKKSNGG